MIGINLFDISIGTLMSLIEGLHGDVEEGVAGAALRLQLCQDVCLIRNSCSDLTAEEIFQGISGEIRNQYTAHVATSQELAPGLESYELVPFSFATEREQ